jgi:hypothetical protein
MPSMMALRALKRRLSNVVFARMLADQQRRETTSIQTGPGGHSGTTLQSSVTDLTPDVGSSDKPHPGPATPHPRTSRAGLPPTGATQRRPQPRSRLTEGHPPGPGLDRGENGAILPRRGQPRRPRNSP